MSVYARIPKVIVWSSTLQCAVGGTVHDVPVGPKARTVTRAIPGLLERIPADDASQVGADGGALMKGTSGVTENGDLLQSPSQDGTVTRGNLRDVRHFTRRHQVGVLRRDIEIFAREFLERPQ